MGRAARCDLAEVLLDTGKYKEAGETSAGFASDPVLSRSRYKPLGLYHLGYAKFALKDYPAAGRALSQLAPFQQDFGPHARYLLARVHHLSDERPEAAAQYKAVIEGFDAQKKAAQQALQQNPQQLDPDKRAALEAVSGGPLPDYVVRANFYGAVLQYEEGRYPEAADQFAKLIQAQPKSPLVPEAQLRIGFCRLQQKNFPEAVKALEPLREHPQFADRAQWWMARAMVGATDPNNPAAVEQSAKNAVEALRKAAEKAGTMAATDPEAKTRRGDILMDLADTQQVAKQFKEAAATYGQILSENIAPDRAEEATERRVTALHLAGQYKESDELAAKFQKDYPRSTLLPAVLFREAENAYLAALAAAREPATKDNKADLDKQFGAALAKYENLVKKYPEFEYVDLARQAMATAHYRMGHYDQAIDLLNQIPEPSRNGELATVPYLLADCMIRTLPPEVDDALQANRLIDTAESAAKLLENFVASQPKSPQAPDAWLKLGHCYSRIGVLLIDPAERTKTLAKAKDAYDKCQQQFPQDPSIPTVVYERAKVMANSGDPNMAGQAANELRRFQGDPFKNNPNAPLALLRLSSLLRAQNNPGEAVNVITKCRADHEAALMKDPERAPWAAMLQYENALALKDGKKPAEAKAMFDAAAKQFADQPAGLNAAWRAVQCRREEAAEQLANARKVAAKPGVKPEEVNTAYAAMTENLKALTPAADALRARLATAAKPAKPGSVVPSPEALQWVQYELAWCGRLQADVETDAARRKLQSETAEKLRAKLVKEGVQPSALPPPAPQVATADLPITKAEQQARQDYQALIAAGPSSPLAAQARYELAELLINRGEHDAALDYLVVALENTPPVETAEHIKLRIAACLLAKNDGKNALAQAKAVLLNPKSPAAAEARYLVGEALIRQQDWPKAVEALLPFRDQDPWRNAPEVADRALLRLGYAYAQSGNWDASRQACEALVGRFAQSPWADEARYAIGWAQQNQKRYDEACNAYAEVTRRTASEAAAKAQYNIGVCRAEQKRYPEALKALDAVAYTYDYPEWSASACYQAALIQSEQKQPAEAVKLLQRVVKDYPDSHMATLAKQRLSEFK